MLTTCIVATALAGPALAIDNPDAPDRTAAFLERARPFEQRFEAAESNEAWSTAGASYAKFLDAELNRTYRQLLQKMDGESGRKLIDAQQRWLQFRDGENQFIASHWTVEHFGTSSTISRIDHRNAIVKSRVLTLLDYLRDYADTAR